MGYVPPPLQPVYDRSGRIMSTYASRLYVLDENHNPVVEVDMHKWGKFFENEARTVAKTRKDGVDVSTVFLGMDHGWGEGPPILFETMIFGGEHNEDQWRCSTWDEAVKMHERACEVAYGKSYPESVTKRTVILGD